VAHFTFVDLFAGIGGFRIPCEALGGECLAFAENSKSAISIYNENFSQTPNLGNVQAFGKINSDRPIDLITAGVPCQPWSIAGKKKGFKDPRGRLWFSTINIIKENKPKVFIIENVAGLSDPRNEENLKQIKDLFTKIGYTFKIFELSARDFGLVQDRVRVFIVGFKNKIYLRKIKSITGLESKPTIQNLLFGLNTKDENPRYPHVFRFTDVRKGIHSWDLMKTTKKEKDFCNFFFKARVNLAYRIYNKRDRPLSIKDIKENYPNFSQEVFDSLIKKNIIREINRDETTLYDFKNSKNGSGLNVNNKQVLRVYSLHSTYWPTITFTRNIDYFFTDYIPKSRTIKSYHNNFMKHIISKNRFRMPTEKEKLKLQGFPEDFKTYTVSNSVAGRHIGNAVPPPVILNILKAIIKTEVFDI
jgi:DNA (cytosine-5)-methyltransferase 1